MGWHMGKVCFFGVGTVGARWKKACETANVMVYYTKKDTGGLLNGEEGRELGRGAAAGHGAIAGRSGSWSGRRRGASAARVAGWP